MPNFSQYTIATLGSHTALQICKGAKDEGFRTLVITTNEKAGLYHRYPFVDEVITISQFSDFSKIEARLLRKNIILIPHGSFVAYLGFEANKTIRLPYFGNKTILDWEGNRKKQLSWLHQSGIKLPKKFSKQDTIDRSVIVKSYGAAGGSNYFVVHSQKEFNQKITKFHSKKFIVQEYIIGVPIYIHYFYSPLTHKLELLSIDRRYETNVDSLGRLPLSHQESIAINPSFVVVGNSPLSLRESLLPKAYDMAEHIIHASRQLINKKGLYGPFCLETIVTEDQEFYAIEISCRIVAGTNLYINGSPYSDLLYSEPMSTGRRIAREIKLAIKSNQLDLILD